MRRFVLKGRKRENFELELVGVVEKLGVREGLVQVKVRNYRGEERIMFVTLSLNELLRKVNEGKLEIN